jgi:hypothetical protein
MLKRIENLLVRSMILSAGASIPALTALLAPAAAMPVPQEIQGVWAPDGRCAVAAARFTVTATEAGLGTAPPHAVVYIAHDGPGGAAALHWAEEGNVDNFVYDRQHDTLVHNLQGYGVPAAETLHRCAGP